MSFTFRRAVREQTPLLIGLVGPSGSGKTYSALELATGIQQVRGGEIAGADSEARRMLHYAAKFAFLHAEFGPPFSSKRYAELLVELAQAAKGGVCIVDSMSHEHEGEGGYLDFHEKELDRIAGQDHTARMKRNFDAWRNPSADRRMLINKLLQINCAFIFCFRAKEKLEIIPGQNPKKRGYQAIAGEEFAFEMTVRCLLQDGARGVPDWSEEAFKLGVPKRAADHVPMFEDGKPLSRDTGRMLALWSKGDAGATTGGQTAKPANKPTAATFVDPFPGISDAVLSDLLMGAAKEQEERLKIPFAEAWDNLAFFVHDGKDVAIKDPAKLAPDAIDEKHAKALRMICARLKAAEVIVVPEPAQKDLPI